MRKSRRREGEGGGGCVPRRRRRSCPRSRRALSWPATWWTPARTHPPRTMSNKPSHLLCLTNTPERREGREGGRARGDPEQRRRHGGGGGRRGAAIPISGARGVEGEKPRRGAAGVGRGRGQMREDSNSSGGRTRNTRRRRRVRTRAGGRRIRDGRRRRRRRHVLRPFFKGAGARLVVLGKRTCSLSPDF